MNSQIPVSTIMTKEVHTVSPDDSLEEIKVIFDRGQYYHLPVVEQEKVIGIISRTDYFRLQDSFTLFKIPEAKASNERIFHSLLVRDVMSKPVMTIGPDHSLEQAVEKFRSRQFHCLPVVDEAGALLGIVTVMDLLHYAYDNA